MRVTTKIFLATIVLFFILPAIAKDNQKPQWKGKIEYENGVKVVKNPREPLFGEITLELEEDLVIGNEEDENYMFYQGIHFDVDEEGNIYISDRPNCRIQKFDIKGKYIQTIGRKGQGPGEFQKPRYVYVDADGNIYVADRGKLQIFDQKGQFKKSIRLDIHPLWRFGITGEGKILALAIPSSFGKLSQKIVLLSSDGKLLETITSFTTPKTPEAVSQRKVYLYGTIRCVFR